MRTHFLRGLIRMDELYHLDKDPYEETNIIDRSDARETLQQMQAELRRLLEQTHYAAPAPAVNPAAPEARYGERESPLTLLSPASPLPRR